ncbi:conserved hypothetical protein [Theileria orientalis strain Shintoku]|uniref:Major facilitator superfamily MFS-1 protein n=1 Tax=Theileria orientalis strain Shintoku TaxID=869250 RepID=J4C3V0_THEOR|nr:conserved hypothetical protein [Theileria orientalis strain Shintoku]BAM41076.1 conserved hypothetical protein [Theileria orientalis strain Shintoku]|eukprot:XP_009691377.1 conserved hypothetical protein [Theileria orientalis strain Shintoku]
MNEFEKKENAGSTKKWALKIRDSHDFSPPYIHPLTRFLIYSYIVLLTGNVSMGWTGFQEVLYKAGSFEELCDIATSEITTIRTHRVIGDGALLKFFGHKMTFLFGHMVNFLCWFVMGLFPRNGPLLRIIMVIIGLSSEATYLPVTTVSLYFPEDKSLILSILGSIRTLSFLMPTILSYIYLSPRVKREHFYLVAITFGLVAYFGSFVIGMFIVPWDFFKKHGTGKAATGSNSTSISTSKTQSETFIQRRLLKSHTLLTGLKRTPEVFRNIIKSQSTPQTVLFIIAASLNIASVEFMNKAQRELFTTATGETVIPVFKYVQVLTFFPGLFVGYFADRYGTAETMSVMQIFLLTSYLMLTVGKYNYMLFGCLLYIIGGSMYLSVVYFYIYETFAPENVGIALGFILIFCGTAIMCNIPLYNYALRVHHPRSFSKISWVLSGYMAVSLLSNVGVILVKRHARNKRLYNKQASNVL